MNVLLTSRVQSLSEKKIILKNVQFCNKKKNGHMIKLVCHSIQTPDWNKIFEKYQKPSSDIRNHIVYKDIRYQKSMLRIRIRWIRKILASWIRIRIQGGLISTKNSKKIFFTPKLQIWTFERREIIKTSSFLNGSSSFRIKISEKIEQQILKVFCKKKISKS